MKQVRSRKSKCPNCDEYMIVRHNATTMNCPHCHCRLGIIGNRSRHKVDYEPSEDVVSKGKKKKVAA